MQKVVRRYTASIVPNVLKAKTFSGRGPRTTHEKYQICEQDVSDMIHKLVGVDFCYNHDEGDVVGRVVASFRNPRTNSWDVSFDIDPSTRKGADMIGWIDEGRMRGVSLQHIWGSNKPIEVSACWRGARDGSIIYHAENVAVAASGSRKRSRPIYFDSNHGCYTRARLGAPDTELAVAASSDSDLDSLVIFDIVMSSPPLAVAGSATDASSSPPPASMQGLSLDSPQQAPSAATTSAPAAPAAPAAAAAAPAAAPAATDLSSEEVFKRYSVTKNMLQYNKGILGNADKQVILDSLGSLELEKEKEKARADALEARLKVIEDERKKVSDAAEAEMRKKQDALNASAKQKIGDLVSSFDDEERPGLLEGSNEVLASMTAKQLEFFASFSENVKASRTQQQQQQPQSQTERYMADFLLQRNQQQQQQQLLNDANNMSAPPPHPFPVLASGGGASAAAAAAAAAGGAPVLASRNNVPSSSFYFGAARAYPVQSDAVKASAAHQLHLQQQRKIIGPSGQMRNYQSSQCIMGSTATAEAPWHPGVGANIDHSRITDKPDIQRAMVDWMNETPPGDGTGTAGVASFRKRNLFQSGDNYSTAMQYCKASRSAAMNENSSMGSDRSYMQGLGGLLAD